MGLLLAAEPAAATTTANTAGPPTLTYAVQQHPGEAILPGFNSATLPANDDGSTTAVSLPFSVNFYGTTYNSIYVNNNGNVTFGSPVSQYTPEPLDQISVPMIAPFWADVDTRVGNVVTYGTGTVNGKKAFGVNWPGVGCYDENDTVTDTFQLILIDQSHTGPGNFDIEFNYGNIQWDSGQASGGNGQCLGGTAAAAGYTNGGVNGNDYTYELPGSGIDNALLSSNPITGLSNQDYNSTVPGQDIFPVRSGTPLTESSPTWSGLVTQNGGPYTGADATFTVPTVTCTKKTSAVAIWTGIGGSLPSDGQTLIQNGIEADCDNGAASYYAWWENNPQVPGTRLDPSTYPVHPGDNIAVSVTVPISSQVDFFFDDYTAHWSTEVTKAIPTATPVGTAECIVEAPLQAAPKGRRAKTSQLTDFGTIHFSSCSSDNTAGTTCYLPGIVNCAYGTLVVTYDMQNKHRMLANTVWPTNDGSAFDVTWLRSS